MFQTFKNIFSLTQKKEELPKEEPTRSDQKTSAEEHFAPKKPLTNKRRS
jgi:hypothetical protein